ncbi:hypothetical protein D9619_000177 [Psilocybe cf. subviscida]|uniref:Uncharacterized protein n=1 Tax=Psilocybe cf. subviscida TaxID=2480587 RepID=A0A8H5F3F2_9AGAR|nr:hypothetical protein D9619_000177 [Psilocybe cf. subviscida]
MFAILIRTCKTRTPFPLARIDQPMGSHACAGSQFIEGRLSKKARYRNQLHQPELLRRPVPPHLVCFKFSFHLPNFRYYFSIWKYAKPIIRVVGAGSPATSTPGTAALLVPTSAFGTPAPMTPACGTAAPATSSSVKIQNSRFYVRLYVHAYHSAGFWPPSVHPDK